MDANEHRLNQLNPILDFPYIDTLPEFLGIPDGMCTYCNVNPGTTTDEVVPCMYGGRFSSDDPHLNKVPSCNSCNQSKGNKVGDLLFNWIRNGIKKGDSNIRIPAEHHEKMIEWYQILSEMEYIRTDNPVILDQIRRISDENKNYFAVAMDRADTEVI
jgi:hypothetical protein